ncbi:hypothetical protein D1BOALGB6SA_5314 [Olavius sp. associated proteobacterium Delta 1]|nr:hypothetical protein D1BOALGB6SA_5314 [Olavius sp. associated proteobacterium Delta 1]
MILWSVVAVVSILIMTWLITGKSHELGPYAIAANTFIIAVAVGLLLLIRIGYVKSAGFVFVAFIWCNITFQAFTSDGVRCNTTWNNWSSARKPCATAKRDCGFLPKT